MGIPRRHRLCSCWYSPPVDTSFFVNDVKFSAHGQVMISSLAIGMEGIDNRISIRVHVRYSAVVVTFYDVEV